MGKVFEFLGMTVAVVRADDNAAQLRAAFSADVVYITAQQLAFTYLGDNTLKDESDIVRPLLSHAMASAAPASWRTCLPGKSMHCSHFPALLCVMRQRGSKPDCAHAGHHAAMELRGC